MRVGVIARGAGIDTTTTTRIRRTQAPRSRRNPPLLGSSPHSTYAGGISAGLRQRQACEPGSHPALEVRGFALGSRANPLSILTNALHVATFPAMKTVSIRDAKNRLTELAREVEGGETITVTRNGRPVFDIVPHRKRGGLNLAAGEAYLRSKGISDPVPFIADDFDAPLPEDFLLQPSPPKA